LSGTTRVSRYQKKHSPTHLSWQSSNLYQLLPSTTIHSILPCQFKCLRIFSTASLQVFLGLPLGLDPSTSYSIVHTLLHPISVFFATHAHTIATCFAVVPKLYHIFPVSLSQLCTWDFIFYLNIIPCSSLLAWSAKSFSFLTGQVSLPCSILFCIQLQLLYSLPLLISGNAGRKKSPTSHHLRTIVPLCMAISLQMRYVSTIGKKLVKQQHLLHMSW